MATVGNLFINVKARTASFGKKMKGVRATVTRMAAGFGRLAMKVGKFAAVLAGVAVAAIMGLTRVGIKSVDLLGKTADKLGIIPKKLQVLQLAAKSTGVTVETFNMAMQRMVRRVSEAGHGFGEAKGALQELGIDAKALSTLPVDEQFRRISDEMEKVATQGDRVRLAMKLFDSEGVALVNTMKGGSVALDEFKKEAEELGLLLSGEQVRAVETLETKLGFLSAVWSSLTQQLAVQFAPVLTEITNRIISFIKSAGGMGEVAEFIVRAFFYAGAAGLDVIRAVQIGFMGLKSFVIKVAAEITMAMSWSFQKIAEGMSWLEGLSIKSAGIIMGAYGFAAGMVADAANAMGAETVASFVRSTGIVSTMLSHVADDMTKGSWTDNVQSDMADFLKDIGTSLGDQATETGLELLNKFAEGWNLAKVSTTFESLKDKFMGEGFDIADGGLDVEVKAEGLKGVVASLQTAIGGFKVEADGQERLLRRTLAVEEAQLKTSKDILTAVRNDGSVALQ